MFRASLEYAWGGGAKFVSLALQFLVIYTVAKYIGLEAVGVFGPLVALVLVGGIIMNRGQAARAYIELPHLVHKGDLLSARVRASGVLWANARSAALFSPLIFICSWLYFGGIWPALVATAIAVCFSLLESLSAILRCLNRIAWAEFVRNAFWRSAAILLIAITALSGNRITSDHVDLLLLAATITSVLTTIVLLRLPVEEKLFPSLEEREIDRQNWAIQSLQAVGQNLDIILAPILFGPLQSAAYFIAARLATLVSLPLTITNPIATPLYSRLARTGPDAYLKARIRLNTILNIFTGLTVFFILFFFGDGLAYLLVGQQIDVWTIGFVLSIGYMASTAVGPSMQVSQLFGFRLQSLALQISSVAMIMCAALAGYMQDSLLFFALGVALGRTVVSTGIAWLLYRIGRTNIFTGSVRS